jgi:hypothetical protein
MNDFWWWGIVVIARYLHIVCTTVLVGGTLFYEMVVPLAIDELRQEQQLLIFARARWIFKWLVWSSAFLLIASGVVSTYVHWPQYANENFGSAAERPGWWWAAHASTGILSVLIALSLTIGNTPPAKPIRWMRLNLIALLLVIFLATATRQARLQAEQQYLPGQMHSETGG